MKYLTAFSAACAFLPLVAGHGFVSEVVIDGDAYEGNSPDATNIGPSPIRKISTIDPVKGATNANMFCGQSAEVASVVAPANPGSVVTFQWADEGGQLWPHNTGPLMTYMALCGDTTCDKYTDTDAKWFKIDQVGKINDTTWLQADIMLGMSYTITLPDNIAPGDYLIRHEIIALHLATSLGGAEFYPSCTQVRIGGTATGTPNQTVSFPGAYSDNDPGIYDPSVFDDGATYVFPGPPVSNLAATDGEITPAATSASFHSASAVPTTASGSGKTSSNTSGASSTDAATPSASAGSSGSTGTASASASAGTNGTCRLKKRTSPSVNINFPRHYSRIMRSLLHAS